MTKMTVFLSICVTLSIIMIDSHGCLANAKPPTTSVPGLPTLLQSRTSIVSQGASISVTRRLYSRTKMFLQIDMNRLVSGTSNCSSKFIQLELLSVGSGLKRIKGVASGRYLAMNNKGTVYSTTQSGGDEALFVEKMQPSGYITFASSKYYRKTLYDTFVAIKRNGRVKPGHLTNKLQKPAHFLILPAASRKSC